VNRIDLKERIAISDAFTPEERTFLLDAINAMPETTALHHNPSNNMGRIEQLWAYLSVDDGGEGLCAAPMPGAPMLTTMPLIAADRRRLELIKPIAHMIARKFGMPVRLARFRDREDVEIIRP
jgi:hypothetical protein